jgi:hypothetical protein
MEAARLALWAMAALKKSSSGNAPKRHERLTRLEQVSPRGSRGTSKRTFVSDERRLHSSRQSG